MSIVLLPAHTMRNVAEGRQMHHPKYPGVYRSGTPNAPEGEAQAVLPWELSVGSPPHCIIWALGAERPSPAPAAPQELSTVGRARCRTQPFTATLGWRGCAKTLALRHFSPTETQLSGFVPPH